MQPPAVEFTGECGAWCGTTVPPWTSPWDLHSQYPPIGIVVGQASRSAWQMLAARAGVARVEAARRAALRRWAGRMAGAFNVVRCAITHRAAIISMPRAKIGVKSRCRNKIRSAAVTRKRAGLTCRRRGAEAACATTIERRCHCLITPRGRGVP